MLLAESWREWSLALKNLVLPIFCRQCGERLLTEENGYFCPACWEASPRIERPFCTLCGRPHEMIVGFGPPVNYPCEGCRARPNRYIDRIFGAALYHDSIQQAIKLLKFHEKLRLAGPLGEVMRDFALQEMPLETYQFIVPVPLHKVRQRDRRYNQATLLAKEIAPVFPNACVDEALRRIRPTRTQSKLKPEERLANVRGAFAVDGNPYPGATILLVDDVVTTAGTVSECARALKRAGAARVDVFAVALAAHVRDPEERLL